MGLLPVNNDFQETEDGIEIFVLSSGVHADIIMPIETDVINFRESFPPDDFEGDIATATHIAVGWGDRGFLLNTPRWSDLEASTAAKAVLWPSASCLRVAMRREEDVRPQARSVRISQQQYAALVQFVRSSFRRDDTGRPQPIAGASYDSSDAFYEANGRYWFLNTCNSWAGRAMQAAGIRTPWLSPLPKTVYLYLPEEDGSEERLEAASFSAPRRIAPSWSPTAVRFNHHSCRQPTTATPRWSRR